jgi:hypothetical protein
MTSRYKLVLFVSTALLERDYCRIPEGRHLVPPFATPTTVPNMDPVDGSDLLTRPNYGVEHSGKKVLATILEACPLVTGLPQRKYGRF